MLFRTPFKRAPCSTSDSAAPQPEITIRGLFERDMYEVQEIERVAFENPWTFRDFQNVFASGQSVSLVAVAGGDLVGYLIGVRWPERLEILNLAVDHRYRRRGIARQLVDRVLAGAPGQEAIADVSESSLESQLFFRAVGFRAVRILRDVYESGEAVYRFRHRVPRGRPIERDEERD
jgi:ribosomal-protein-alanine N-acetyltransferase